MDLLPNKIDNYIYKTRIYLGWGDEAPKGARILQGPNGGRYYEGHKVMSPKDAKRDKRVKAAIHRLQHPDEHRPNFRENIESNAVKNVPKEVLNMRMKELLDKWKANNEKGE